MLRGLRAAVRLALAAQLLPVVDVAVVAPEEAEEQQPPVALVARAAANVEVAVAVEREALGAASQYRDGLKAASC